MSNPDIGRIKRNISKMIDMGAPEADIDAYLQEEGVSLSQLRNGSAKSSSTNPQSHVWGLTPKASHGGDNPDAIVDSKMKFIADKMGVGIDEPLTPDQLDAFLDAYIKTEGSKSNNVGNLKNVGGEGFQAFDSPEAGRAAIKAQVVRDFNRGQTSIGSLIMGKQIGTELDPPEARAEGSEAPPEPEDVPESSPAPQDASQAPADRQLDKPKPRVPEPDNGWNNFFSLPDGAQTLDGLAKGAGSVAEGIGDTIGIVGAPLNVLINKATGSHLSTDLGKSLREGLGLPKNTNRVADDLVSGATGGLTFAGAAGAGARGTSGLAQKALAELGATPGRDAIGGAAAALSGDAAEAAGAGPLGQTAAAMAGGMVGHSGVQGARAAKEAAGEWKDGRFATREAKTNPYAAFDAEIVDDLTKARDSVVGPNDPKGRAPVTAKTINSVEQRYTAQFKTAINQLDMPKIEKMKLHAAIEGKYSLPTADIDALRGTVAGDAVADSITKVQRVRALTPELARNPSLFARAGQLTTAVTDALPIPGYVGKGIRLATKATMGDAEAARVHAAQALLNKQRAYSKIGEITGPSGQRESSQGLWDAADQALAAREAEAAAPDPMKLARQKEAAWSAKQKMQGNQGPTPSQRSRQENAAWNQQAQAGAITPAQKAAQENAMWANAPDAPVDVPKSATNAEISGWENITKLARDRMAREAAAAKASAPAISFDGPTPPKAAKAVPVGEQLINKAVEAGIPGTSRTRAVFKDDRLGGLTDTDFDALLAKVSTDLPEAAPELERIRLNHPTKDRKFGSAITPHLKDAMEKMGIAPAAKDVPAPVPVDDAAQARLAQTDGDVMTAPKPTGREADLMAEMDKINPVKVELAEGPPVRASDMGDLGEAETKRVGEIQSELAQLRKVDRPIQWEQGKNRYVTQANTAHQGFLEDQNISPQAKAIVGNAPVQIRDNFKTTDDALRFIDDRVLPDLQSEGVHPEEIASVKSYLSDIAHSKPYYDATAYEAGTRANPRGRPPKDTK